MRINTVKSARKDQGSCESCREPITAGMSYKFIAPRHGAKRKRHQSCPTWRPSEMVGGKMATAYAAQENAHDSLDQIMVQPDPTVPFNRDLPDDLRSILSECAEGATECAGEYQDGLDAMPEQFQYGPVGEEIQEKISALETWAEDLESWSPDSEEPEGDEDPEDWAQSLVDSAREVVDGLEL